jgi:tetratricopeptide (TPR) repeat protein
MLLQARSELGRVDKTKIRRFEYFEILGWIYALEKRYEDAKEIYEEIILTRPYREASLNNLAEIYNQLGQFEKAVELYDKLIALHPKKTKYRQWREEIIEKIRAKGRETL